MMMEKKISNCNPSICLCWWKNNPNELMTNDWIFITKEIYKTLCENTCKMKSTCGLVLDKLNRLLNDEAVKLLDGNNT